MPESDVASAPPERSSVYDFLYHDPHRIASFLAQFTQHGHLESLSRSESTAAATTNKSVVTGRAGVPTLGSVGRSGERAASGSVTEALTTTYDPLWANALALLDHLSQHGLIRRDVTRASIGQFVLAQGELDILNLGTLRAAWAENPIRKLVFSGGASKGERAQMEAGFSFIKLLPHSIQAVLRGEIVVWCCLRSDGMTTPADDLLLKHGAAVSGKWSLVGILDAFATHPEVTVRLGSVGEFLKELERVEDELTQPEERSRPDPLDARSGDELEHGLVMRQRLGKGSTALALLVERDGREHVLKVALSPEHNDRLHAEADVMRRLRHQYIVELHDVLTFHDGTGSERVGLLMARAGDATLADRLHDEGRLHLELLERFGEDLLATIDWLEQKGIPHRDIKPENLGTAKVGNQLHLVLFDFSLARMPAENILAGTRHYLDPFLQTRKPPRWDTHAERFAAAVTLHQMAAGSLPRWGDGQSEPAVLDCEATIDADAFEPAVREDLTAFFRKALSRDYRARFDNAEEMLRAWRQLFLAAARPETDTDTVGATPPFGGVEQARLDTLLAAMGLSARAMNAVERMGVRTVHDLLRFPLIQVNRMPGVGVQTRRELTDLARRLAERFPDAAGTPKVPSAGDDTDVPVEAGHASVDELRRLLLPAGRTAQSRRDVELAAALLGLSGDAPDAPWPSQSDIARALGVTPVAVSQTAARSRRRWTKLGVLTRLRHDIVEMLEAHGNVMTRPELAASILARRGSVQEEPLRSRHAGACVRAAVEVERHLAAPRWIVRRLDGPAGVLLARDAVDDRGEPRIDGQKLADFAQRLGRTADELSAADPLLSPARAIDALQAVTAPAGVTPPAPNRLLALAAAVSRNAALSSRLELYPRGMAADRALRLALGPSRAPTPSTPTRSGGAWPDAIPRRRLCPTGPSSTRCSATRAARCSGGQVRPTGAMPTAPGYAASSRSARPRAIRASAAGRPASLRGEPGNGTTPTPSTNGCGAP